MSDSGSKSAIVRGLAEEFLERYRRDERPSLKEHIERHPELAAEIREVFPAMAMMENIALADQPLAGAEPPGGERLLPEPLRQRGSRVQARLRVLAGSPRTATLERKR